MSRSRQDIVRSLLEAADQDPILGSVSRSLVGKELLYFGANVIYQLESATDAISRFQDLSRADFDQLIAFGYTHEVSVATFRPATVTLSLHLPTSQVFVPFTLRLQIGGASFYNIDFVQSGRQAIFYQGVPRTLRSSSQVLDAFQLDSKAIVSPLSSSPWRLFTEFVSGKYQSSYVKLGPQAVPTSVWVFARQADTPTSPVFPYTEFQYGLVSPQALLYKVRTGWDRSINVLFGDTNWAEAVNTELYVYQLYWLEATSQNFTVTKQASITDLISGNVYKVSDKAPGFTITSSTLAEPNSLSYARSSMEQALFESQGLVTETQIKAYVDTIASVNSSRISSSISPNGTPQVQVVVKPTDKDNSAFGFLEDSLYQYGVHGIQYSVLVATPLGFQVRLTALGSSGVQALPRAQQIIASFCEYDKLSINSLVSSAILTQHLQQNGIFDVSAQIVVSHLPVAASQGSQRLLASSQVNTIRQIFDGFTVAFDSNGIWRSLSRTPIGGSFVSSFTSKVGDYIFASFNDFKTYLFRFSGDRLVAVETTNYIRTSDGTPLRGRFIDFSDRGPAFLHTPTSGPQQLLIFPNSAAFREGPASIFNSLTVVTPVATFTFDSADNSFDAQASTALVGSFLYGFKKNSNGELWRASLEASEVVFPDSSYQQIPASNTIRRFTISGNKMYVPTSEDSYLDTLYVLGLDLSASREVFSVISDVSPQNVSFLQSTFSGFEFVSPKEAVTYIARFQSLPSGSLLQLQVQNRIDIEVWGMDDPQPFIVSPQKLYASVTGGQMAEVISTTGNTSSVVYLSNASQYLSEGTVDYAEGVIYGVQQYTDSDYITYEVSGTLVGETTYPDFEGFVE